LQHKSTICQGHQDSEKKGKLTIEESLNVEADKLTHESRALPNVKDYAKFPTNKVNFKLNNKYINSHYPKLVNLAFHSMSLREHYTQKYNWKSKTIDSVWWPVYFQSLSKLPDEDKLRIKKFINNRWPTLQREQKYYNKTSTTSHCRQCKLYSEDENHIIRCRTISRQKIRDRWRVEILQYLSEPHTPPTIRDAICYGLFSWLENGRNTQDKPLLPRREAEVMRVYNNQTDIGWQHFVRGRMSIEWGNMINNHLSTQ
jgi:hypothetical protein